MSGAVRLGDGAFDTRGYIGELEWEIHDRVVNRDLEVRVDTLMLDLEHIAVAAQLLEKRKQSRFRDGVRHGTYLVLGYCASHGDAPVLMWDGFATDVTNLLYYYVNVNSWVGEKDSSLQALASKPGDFTNLSISDYMAASHGFEPRLLVTPAN